MLVLGIDTSLFATTIGWVQTDPPAGRRRHPTSASLWAPASLGHAETLLERCSSLLQTGGYTWDDVGLVTFGKGPGTFTGLRIGATTAKMIHLCTGAPLVGVSSLALTAASCVHAGTAAVVHDARRGEVFFGVFTVTRSGDATTLSEGVAPTALPPDRIEDALEAEQWTQCVWCGDGVHLVPGLSESGAPIAPFDARGNNGAILARLGYQRFVSHGADDPDTCVPDYVRAPDARPSARPLRTLEEWQRREAVPEAASNEDP